MGCDHDYAVPHLDGVAAAGGNGLAAPGDAADQQAVLQVQILQWDAAEIVTRNSIASTLLLTILHSVSMLA